MSALEETRPDGHGRARGLVSGRVSGRRVEARTFAPSAALRDVVACYWMTRWDLRGQAPHVAEMITDPCVNVALEATRSRVVGVSTRIFRCKLEGTGVIRAVKLRAGAARALLGPCVVASFNDRVVPLPAVFADASDLEAGVLAPTDDSDGLAHLERWIVARLRRPLDPNLELAAEVVDRIAKDPSVTTVAQVVRLSGLSLRPLQRLFREQVGAAPKWVIRRYRLREAALRLERGGLESLAVLAAELGYSDHAHLSRDFKAATGRSPAEFARAVWK